MHLMDLNSLPPNIDFRINDAKEAMIDALLNLTLQRTDGSGPDGEMVFGAKPSMRFVSGFLLPRYDATGNEDETSDIHLSTHGLDCQIASVATGPLTVSVTFSIYVRTLPEWDELVRPELDLFPKPSLKKEVDATIRAEVKSRLASAKAAEAGKPSEKRRDLREIQQQIYHEVLAEYQVRVSQHTFVAHKEANDEQANEAGGQRNDYNQEEDALEFLGSEPALPTKQYVFENDDVAREIDIPHKWLRLPVALESFSADLSDEKGLQESVAMWTERMRLQVSETVAIWSQSDAGQRMAYRRASLKPSNFRSEEAWSSFLTEIRKRMPVVHDLAPNLDGLMLTVTIDPDLRDTTRRNLRIILENGNQDVPKPLRGYFEHTIYQVQITVELPHASHRPLKLDRVEASYRFREFMNYAAIGINCGVTETLNEDNLRLRTTWLPRYHQPRIVPAVIESVTLNFAELGFEGFDPANLRPLVEAYDAWINTEETNVDPTVGVEDAEAAEREEEKFRQDLEGYRLENRRIALGIELLEFAFKRFKSNPGCRESLPYRAWLLLNRTFQASGSRRGIETWRLFQIAFVLAHIPAIVSRMDEFSASPWFDPDFDEETATLLYFPTGGGKSEAFFGLLVFNLFLDRLRGKSRGVTALIRYPLRLLTLQQSQRLLSILMRAELLRRRESIVGHAFEIGFWVGSMNTPNQPDDKRLHPIPDLSHPKHTTDKNLGSDYEEINRSFNKIPTCPICGHSTGLRRLFFPTAKEIGIVCFNDRCSWNEGTDRSPLPFLIVDRDIYRHAPAVLLGVIDKLALIGQHPATINRVIGMFGLARWQELGTERLVFPTKKMLGEEPRSNGCEALAPAYREGREVFHDPLPSLIIQDEAHLLEESLGTFAGLFETTLELLFVRAARLLGDRVSRSPFGTRPVRLPKVVAATATVSMPERQFGSLYLRRHMHFPYPGTSIYRSFYGLPAKPPNPERCGSGGLGPRAPEIEAPRMRTYCTIMTNGRSHTVTTVAALAAYHLAVTELWYDLIDDERRDAAVDRLLSALTPGTPLTDFHRQAIKACALYDPAILPTVLDLLRISLTYVTNKKGGDQIIEAFDEEVRKLHERFGRKLDRHYTRLISGGVDVAQIQEIMSEAEDSHRPGENFPNLEQSLRNIVATSAISGQRQLFWPPATIKTAAF